MRARTLLVLTAIVSSILGAVTVYMVMTVPNDLQAGRLLKQARADIAGGKTAAAHIALTRVILQYPRTDAAAAATVALVKLEEQQRQRMQAEIAQLRAGHQEQRKAIADLQKGVETLRKAPRPAPAAVTATQSAKKAPTKQTPAKKPTTTRRKKR